MIVELSTIHLFIFLFFQISSQESVLLDDIIKQIRENEFEPYQTIIMHDGKEKSIEILNEITPIALKDTPSKVINYIIDSKKKSTITSRSLYQTSLFIIIFEFTNKYDTDNIFNYIKQITLSYTYPRCLMILLSNYIDERKFLLERAWEMLLFDLTILQFQKLNKSKGLLSIDNYQRNILINYYNKFTGIYTFNNYTKGEKIFPLKLKDLNGYEMKAVSGSFNGTDIDNYQENVFINENNAINHHLRTLETFSTLMNFKLLKLSNKILMECLAFNECEIFIYFYSGETFYFTNNANTMLLSGYKFVVPILKKEESLEITFQTSIFMVILSCGFVIFIWMILWFLKFDKRFLQFLHYLELLLGISVPYDVNKLTDRIILITILFGFWQFSSSLHSILTSTSVNKENDDLINTLKDLKESTLIPYVFPGIDYYSNNTDNEIMKKLIDRSKNYTSEIDCILELRKNKNIACLMLDTNAQLQLWKDLDKNGLPTVKIIDEVIAQDTGFIICELNSPYIFEFERHMGKIIQSGLYYKWLNDYLNVTLGRREIIGNSFGNEENVLELSLIIILAVGFTISIIVFFIELLIKNRR